VRSIRRVPLGSQLEPLPWIIRGVAAGVEPALGSLMPLPRREVSSSRTVAGSGASARRCRSQRDQVGLHFQAVAEGLEMALSPWTVSAIDRAWVTKSVRGAPFLGHRHGTTGQASTLLMISQSKRRARIGDIVALNRDCADYLFGELARRHLPGSAARYSREVHGVGAPRWSLAARRGRFAGRR